MVGGRFRILAVLGAGPLGATYRVRDTVAGHDLALKALCDELCPSEQEREGFVARVEMFAGRTIAGCAMPLEVGADERVAYAITPLVDGVTLRAVLGARAASRRPLSLEESLRVMLALSASASALHSATPHGALRPENVIVTSRGLILTDCAIAVALPAERLQPRVRSFARAIPYVSPEVAAGRRITATADFYALGAIAIELLAGSPNPRAIDHAELPAEVAAALRGLLEREPTKRPAALGALLDALARACGFERRPPDAPLPVPAVPETRASRAVATSPPPTTVPTPRTMPSPSLRPETSVTRAGRPSAATFAAPPAPAAAPSRAAQSARPPAMPPAMPRLPPMPPMPSSRAPMAPGVLQGARPSTPAVPVLSRGEGRGPALPSVLPPSKRSVVPLTAQSSPKPPGAALQTPALSSVPLERRSTPPLPSQRATDIDPHLIRVARRLDAERHGEPEDFDPSDAELIDE